MPAINATSPTKEQFTEWLEPSHLKDLAPRSIGVAVLIGAVPFLIVIADIVVLAFQK